MSQPSRPGVAEVVDALAALERGAAGLLVVAHPDDETLGLGGHLARMPGLHVLHLTDGAPREIRFARAAGYATPEDYARRRRAELDRALSLADVGPERRHRAGLADQEVARSLTAAWEVVDALVEALRPAVVLTHAYEGGHPDHDAAAVVVQAAVQATRARGAPWPCRLELPYYHRAAGAFQTGRFAPASSTDQPTSEGHEVELPTEALARKRAMLACFASQRDVLAPFDPSVERIRVAPAYDFARPPHRGPLQYELLGWPTSGAELSEHATRALQALGLAEDPCR